ncbi:MAG TPA: ABC transporter permease [Terriglobia bacterium]
MKLPGGQLRQVLRRLFRSPMFTFVAILTLALGIGANTAIFSVIDGVLLKPLSYPHPEQLISLSLTAPWINIPELTDSPSVYFTFRGQNRSFEDVGVFTGNTVSVTGIAEPEQVRSLLVTDGVIPILGISPALGRSFTRKDDSPGSPDTVILTQGYWRRRFSGDRSIIGRRILIDGKAREVIGVMPQNFRFLDMDVALIQPFRFDRSKTFLGNFSFEGLARLKPGVTLAQANADGTRMLPIVNRSFQAPPGFSAKMFEQARIAPAFRPFKQTMIGDVGAVLWVLMGTIGIVLLIACANVANLLLVRAESRHLELAIRAALGASRARIAGELLLESMTLAALGGACGLLVAFGALRLLVAMAPAGLPRLADIGIDAPVLAFSLGVSLLAGLLFGSIPVFKHAGARLGTGMREGGRGLSQTRERHRARNVLVVAQVALALVLLISSGLMIRTFRTMMRIQPGFADPAHVQTFTVSIPEAQVKDPEKVLRMQNDMLDQIRRVPGVSSAGMTSALPMDGNSSSDVLFARDRVYKEGQLPPIRRFVFISPGLHATLGTPLMAGRDLTWTEIYGHAPGVLISESFAREYWRTPAGALHQQIREGMNDPWREIVGVVGDVYADGVNKKPPTTVYWPPLLDNFWGDKQSIQRGMSFVVRSPRAGSESFLKEIRQAVWSVNPNVPVAVARTLDQIYRKSMARTSFTLVMMAIAAGMALLLGVVGIYGVIAYSVSQRTREIGIRMALGARRHELTAMFVRHGILLTGAGAAIGLIVAFAVMRLMSSLLFHVSPADPLTYLVVSLGLVVIAALASYLPARRTAGVDPSEALRAE